MNVTRLLPLFVIVPLVELMLLIEVGSYIGTVNTVLIVVATGVLGAALMRWQGTKVWNEVQRDMAAGKVPADAMLQGVAVLMGGVVLLTPGFFTDVMGLLLLLPPTRRLFVKAFARRIKPPSRVRRVRIRQESYTETTSDDTQS